MKRLDELTIAIYLSQLEYPLRVPFMKLTSKAFAECSKRSSSSSLVFSMISSEAPWKIAHGVKRTVARGKDRSDHPPALQSARGTRRGLAPIALKAHAVPGSPRSHIASPVRVTGLRC